VQSAKLEGVETSAADIARRIQTLYGKFVTERPTFADIRQEGNMFEVKLIQFVTEILKQDAATQSQRTDAATICSECGKNTFVGLKPFTNIYRRSLCENCGREYEEFLRRNNML
jgi:DNA replicative helicase MCM subunit Mcm2 (Cdc46/Mcm family)